MFEVPCGCVNLLKSMLTSHRVLPSAPSWADLQPHGCPEQISWPVNLPFSFLPLPPKDLEGGPPSKKMKLETSQQNSEEM